MNIGAFNKPILAALLLAGAALSSGCATIASGTDQNVSFDSEPEGATVKVDGKVIGTTPTSATIKKTNDQTLTFEKEGYETVTQELTTKTDPWFFGNIIIGGLFGSTTDFASGAAYEYSPDQYFITLPPKGNAGVLEPRQALERFVVVTYPQLRNAAARANPAEDETFASLLGALEIERGETTRVAAVARTLIDHDNPVDGANAISAKF